MTRAAAARRHAAAARRTRLADRPVERGRRPAERAVRRQVRTAVDDRLAPVARHLGEAARARVAAPAGHARRVGAGVDAAATSALTGSGVAGRAERAELVAVAAQTAAAGGRTVVVLLRHAGRKG